MNTETKQLFTRADYMAKRCTHEQYYRQFVQPADLLTVRTRIGVARLQASSDEHLNDIPLQEWDNMPLHGPSQATMKACGDWVSPAGKVCILKQAARMLLEQEVAA